MSSMQLRLAIILADPTAIDESKSYFGPRSGDGRLVLARLQNRTYGTIARSIDEPLP